jgi:hypothetical protein
MTEKKPLKMGKRGEVVGRGAQKIGPSATAEKEETRPRGPKKAHRSKPVLNGVMTCIKAHQWNVMDLNSERVTVFCPTCGVLTSIRQGLTVK